PDQTVCNGQTVSSITLTGTPASGVTYSWANNNPSIGLAASGTNTIPSFTATNASSSPITATITITPSYIANGVTCAGTQQSFTITVNPSTVVTNPQNVTVCAGGNATFNVTATGMPPFTYQWQLNTSGNTFNNIPGETSSILTITNVTTAMNGYRYQVIVTGACGSVTSNPATLTVNANPTVVVSSLTKCANDPAVTITATPTPAGTYTYVWTVPSGVTNPGNVASFSATIAGTYSVII